MISCTERTKQWVLVG